MKAIGVGMLFPVLSGLLFSACAGGIYTPVFQGEVNVSSPILGLNDEKTVISPAGVSRGGESLVRSFGESWKSVEGDYSGYNFNP
jgi:hypothetical protein